MSQPMEQDALPLPDLTRIDEWHGSMRWAFQEILPRVFLGPFSSRKSTDTLFQQTHITHCLCLVGEHEQMFYQRKLDDLSQGAMSIKVITVSDQGQDTLLDHFRNANAFIREALQNQGSVAVCCSEGMSRSPTFLMAYIVTTYQCDARKAYNVVLNRRLCIAPTDHYRAQLELYQQHCQPTPRIVEVKMTSGLKRPRPEHENEDINEADVKRFALSRSSQSPVQGIPTTIHNKPTKHTIPLS